MTLGQLIATLEDVLNTTGDKVCRRGICGAHSYRGDYSDLAFEISENVSVGAMLAEARGCMDRTFTGYKGGDFKMGEHTECWIAEYGRCGESLGRLALSCLLNDCPTIPVQQP